MGVKGGKCCHQFQGLKEKLEKEGWDSTHLIYLMQWLFTVTGVNCICSLGKFQKYMDEVIKSACSIYEMGKKYFNLFEPVFFDIFEKPLFHVLF